MSPFSTLIDLTSGKKLTEADSGRARRLQIVIASLLASLVFAALWGLAAGSRSLPLAMANVYKVPMIVLLSALSAVPAGLLTWKLSGAECRGTDLLVSFGSGIFGGTLVLAVLSPLVALYYHSSDWAGPLLGQGSALLALFAGTAIFVRSIIRQVPPGIRRFPVILPVSVFMGIQLATLLQLGALASPILPERTIFGHGIDAIGSIGR